MLLLIWLKDCHLMGYMDVISILAFLFYNVKSSFFDIFSLNLE